jgi:Holliday junction resolvase
MASSYQTKVKKYLQGEGYKVIKVISFSEAGYPDLLALKNGKSIWVECKEKNDTLKPLQKLKINELIENGFLAGAMQKGKGVIFGNLNFEVK